MEIKVESPNGNSNGQAKPKATSSVLEPQKDKVSVHHVLRGTV